MAHFRFLDLPFELRLMIYAYLVDPNKYLSGYRKMVQMWRRVPIPPGDGGDANQYRTRGLPASVSRQTPEILLVNRQISFEALTVLYSVPLNLYGAPIAHLVPSNPFRRCQINITTFIAEHLLQNIKYANLRLEQEDVRLVFDIVNIWSAKNQLRQLHVYWPLKENRTDLRWKNIERKIRSFCDEVSLPLISHEVNDTVDNEGSLDLFRGV